MRKQTLERCEVVGIDGVRKAILRGAFQGDALQFAKGWLADAERERDRNITLGANRSAFWLGVLSLVVSAAALGVSVIALTR